MARHKNGENIDIVNQAFGKYIETIRKKKGMTQNKVASRLGVTQPMIDRWEKGKRNIDFKWAVKICAILDGDIKEFMDEFAYYSVL